MADTRNRSAARDADSLHNRSGDGRRRTEETVQVFQTECLVPELDKSPTSLRRVRDWAAAVLDTTPALTIVLDLDGRIVHFNRACQRATGFTWEEVQGKPFWDLLLFPEESDEVKQAFADLQLERFPNVCEGVWRTKDGDLRRIEWSSNTIKDSQGDVEFLVSSGIDVTERQHAQRECDRLTSALEAKKAELDRFAYTVSHDLKSPLITIRGNLGLAAMDAADGKMDLLAQDLGAISIAAERMQHLLRDVTQLLRVGQQTQPFETVPLTYLAHEVVQAYEPEVTKRGIQVAVAPDLPVVQANRALVRQLLQNLMENAIKFVGDAPRPRIEIGWRRDGDRSVCFVRDNGVGVEPQYQKKIFGLFEKLDPQTEGTGVGLAMARRIVETHNGQIWVESEGPGRGSTFCFTIEPESE